MYLIVAFRAGIVPDFKPDLLYRLFSVFHEGIYHVPEEIVKCQLDKDKLVFVTYYSISARNKSNPA